MPFTGMEPILDALKSELNSRLPARLDALEAIPLAPAHTLADIQEITLGDVDYYEKWPALSIVAIESPAEHEDEGRMNFAHAAEIRCAVVSDTPETLQRLLLRYTRAILDALRDADAAGAFTFTLSFNDRTIRYSPQRRNPQENLERIVTIPVLCWAAEER